MIQSCISEKIGLTKKIRYILDTTCHCQWASMSIIEYLLVADWKRFNGHKQNKFYAQPRDQYLPGPADELCVFSPNRPRKNKLRNQKS